MTGDGHRLNDLRDEIGIAHTGDSALRPDISGHAFKCHDGDGAASSAMRACSGVTTSMMTPPLSMSASPRLTSGVPVDGACGDSELSELSALLEGLRALSGLNTIGHEHDAAPGSGLP